MKKRILLITLVFALLLSACGSKNFLADNEESSTDDSSGEVATNGGGSSADDLGSAFNVLMGTTDEPSVFPSYHIELVLDTPQANDDNTALVNETVTISADVAGKNVHIFQVDPGMTEAKEGYIIGDSDKEYKLVDGVWEETMGTIALGWAMWPLQVVMPYGYACALYSNKTGSEEINGRQATVYELDTSKADAAVVASMEAWGVGDMTAKGQVWIDKETGAMIKLVLDYTSEISSLDGSIDLGEGSGHISLEISKVGEVSVTSPVQ